ncbi:Ima1 N-terminal domain-containing protein [Cristinia sonorae]|uniref:Ima1 N-terminal domain-containing protein n=1 Tax=Cristinia sonorae TaxID=1940300 RepID=A0A8K0UKY1_9AGAR|nr:Ima1 N-terminal domain-containing protein [Cristinia sonorae]
MSKLLRRHTRVACFFCQSEANPRDPRAFICASCHCWNRYDSNGELISDEPAMHDERLNARSFARRGACCGLLYWCVVVGINLCTLASPRKDRLPTTFSKSLFCHTCQTNQMLASNLLSNYLPPPNHRDYNYKLQKFDEYRESLELRYPQVCANCQPAVEEEIRRRDDMARVNALGGFLKKSKGRQRTIEATQMQKDKLERSLLWWKVRGLLWLVTLAGSVAVYSSAAFDYQFTRILPFIGFPSIVWTLVSVLWAAWDPTYASKKRDELQGRTVRQYGKRKYNVLQTVAWSSRLLTSILFVLPRYQLTQDYLRVHLPPSSIPRIYCSAMLFLECIIVISSIVVLKVRRTPTLHLVEPHSHSRKSSLTPSQPSSRASTPALDPAASLSFLSISNQPQPQSPFHPIFGLPSLTANPQASETTTSDTLSLIDDDDLDDDEKRQDPNAMDWSPTVSPAKPSQNGSLRRDDNGFLLRPQKFYAPEEPTGLENLFEQTIKLADSGDEQSHTRSKETRGKKGGASSGAMSRGTVVAIVVMLAFSTMAVGVGVWWQRRMVDRV